MNNFPCKECLLKTCCTAHCDKLIQDGYILALYLLTYNTCPDCSSSNLEISDSRQVILCRVCYKAFEKRIHKEYEECLIGSLSSSSPSTSPSWGTSSPLIVAPGPRPKPDAIIYTDITKYGRIKPPSYKEKKPEIKPVEPQPPQILKMIFQRMSPAYSREMIKNFDTHVAEDVSRLKEAVTLSQLTPDWVMKYSDLFIKDPDEEMAEGPSIRVVI